MRIYPSALSSAQVYGLYELTLGTPTSVTYSYNDASDILTTTNQNGDVVKQTFDGLGRLVTIQTYNGSSVYSTQTYTYNWDNLVASNKTAANNTYKYDYDILGRLVKVTNPDSTTITTAYNPVANSKTVTDENGHPIAYVYNWAGQLLTVEQYYSSSHYYTTSYTYDLSGNLLTSTDADSATTSYKYDDLNRLVKTTYPGSSDQTQSYNSIGEMTGMVNQGGTQLNYTYDALNRLTQVSYPGGATVTYSYDNDGNVLSLVNSAVSTYYQYNALDQMTNQTQVISSNKYTILYGYDKVGNVKSILYPDSTNITMTYDFMNRLTKVGTPSTPSAFGTINYTLDSMIGTISYGDGETTTYTYNSMDRPTQIDLKSSTGVKRMDLNYTYDGVGNVETINTESYSYNWLNELTSATGPWGTTTYAYDPAGNQLNETTGITTTTYTYGTYNELTSIGKVNFTYDDNGNTHTIANGSNTWTYSYDDNNRLDQVQENDVTVATYTYDGNGMLVQSAETNTQVFAYQGDNRIYAKNTGTGSVEDYIYADGMLMASLNGTTTDYYHEDALGNIRLVSTDLETTLFSTDYKPYGPLSGASGSIAFEYTGKPTDAATGLYYSGARWYDAASGRFMTEDTDMGTTSTPLSLNRYIYALDDPMKYVDSTGFSPASPTSYEGTVAEEITAYVDGYQVETEVSMLVLYTTTLECTEAEGCEPTETETILSTTTTNTILNSNGLQVYESSVVSNQFNQGDDLPQIASEGSVDAILFASAATAFAGLVGGFFAAVSVALFFSSPFHLEQIPTAVKYALAAGDLAAAAGAAWYYIGTHGASSNPSGAESAWQSKLPNNFQGLLELTILPVPSASS